jgi:hypothetical protein
MAIRAIVTPVAAMARMANNPTVPKILLAVRKLFLKGYSAMSRANTNTKNIQSPELPKLISTREAGKIIDSSSKRYPKVDRRRKNQSLSDRSQPQS